MADPPALRQRRHREHARGNHNLCGDSCSNLDADDRPEACHDLADIVDAYLHEGWSGYPVGIYAQVLRAAAKAVDLAPTPGSLAAFDDALRKLAHALGRSAVN